MFERIKKYVHENVSDNDFANYLLRPIDEGKHYHIGGISELMDNTPELSDEDVEELICEKLIEIPEDVFTLEYYWDMDAEGAAKENVKDLMILLVQKISPTMVLIMEYICGDEIILNPIIAIIPTEQTNFDYRNQNFPEVFMQYLQKDGVSVDFIKTLCESPVMTTIGDVSYFCLDPDVDGEDESEFSDAIEDLWNSAISIIYRFAILKKQGVEVRVTPNTKLETKGYLKLRNIPKDCYVIRSPDGKEFLGFTRRNPER